MVLDAISVALQAVTLNQGAEHGKALEEIAEGQTKEAEKELVPVPIKGKPVRVFEYAMANGISNIAVDCRQANAVHIAVIVSGATPSATISVEGGAEEGGFFLPLDDPNASRATVTANDAWDVMVGSAWAKIRIASISGTFGAGLGFTIIVTPYVAATQPYVQLAAGTAAIGKLAANSGVDIGDVDVTSLPAATIGSVTAAKLAKTKQPRASVTCTNADTDYAAAAAIPAGTKYVVLYASNAFVASIGEATSATVGVWVGAGNPALYPVTVTGTAADDTLHFQSPTAGTVVWYSCLQD